MPRVLNTDGPKLTFAKAKIMKLVPSLCRATTGLAAAVMIIAGAILPQTATAQALQGSVVLRPLTPQEIKDYSLTGAQGASGLSAVGVGTPAYLEALVNRAIAPSNIVSVTWVLTTKPLGSVAELAASPLGANVPTYKMADRASYQVAGRTMLRPDISGQYTVVATITTALANGITNLTTRISAGTYLGSYVCSLCHSGGAVGENIYTPWSETLHAHAFEEAINGQSTDHFAARCTSCHVVGYDTNTNAVNGGFDDVATDLGWTFPTNISSGNWAAMPAALQNVANIQCESCHGPGSEHAYAFGNTNLVNWPRLGKTYAAGACSQCHDSLSHHVKSTEWNNSRHAIATRSPSGAGRAACVRCHTAAGFAEFIATTNQLGSNLAYEAITCAACHDPHDATHPHQLRAANIYTLPEGTTVTNVGFGALCMTCHHSRNGAAEQNITNFAQGKPTWAGGSSFGVHDSTAGDMIEGVNGITYGKVIPSGSHSVTIPDVCVGCHMQPVAATDPAFGKAGGHTFSMNYPVVINGVTNIVAKTDVCVQCHGPMEDFNLVRKDYNGDGVVEGIQTEVQKLLNRLSTLLPNSTYQSNPSNYVADGLVKDVTRTSVKTNWPTRFLNGAWNHMFVNVEGSHGIHNAPYAIGLLRASIADLTGDANNDGLSDAWQIQYFGSATNKNAAPNATPAGDGIPNWLKFGLGLNPTVAGIVVPDGVVWANGSRIGGSTNSIRIYLAAEIAFDTEVGVSYQIQAISTLGGGWTNVGAPIAGTGNAISYVTPTRSKLQQYYRVVHTP
jgi:hypothetical protein